MIARRLFLSVILCCFLTACAEGPGWEDPVAPKEDIKMISPQAFAGVDTVVVAGFTVGFALVQSLFDTPEGGLRGNRGTHRKNDARVQLTGIGDETLQAIADQAYARFTASLRNNGYNVIDRATLLQHETFKNTATWVSPHWAKSGSVFGASPSFSKYFSPSGFGGIKPFPLSVSGLMSEDPSYPSVAARHYAEATGVPVLFVSFMIDPAYAQGVPGTEAFTVVPRMVVSPRFSHVSLIGGQGSYYNDRSGGIKMDRPLILNQPFRDVSTGEHVDDHESPERIYTVTTTPTEYAALAQAAIGEASEKFVALMASARVSR